MVFLWLLGYIDCAIVNNAVVRRAFPLSLWYEDLFTTKLMCVDFSLADKILTTLGEGTFGKVVEVNDLET